LAHGWVYSFGIGSKEESANDLLPAALSTNSVFSGETVIEPVIPQTGTLTTGPVTESQSTNLPTTDFPTSSILWGALAAAALGALTADAVQKKSFGGVTNPGVAAQTSTLTSGGLTVPAGEAQSMNFSTEPVTNSPTTNPLTTPGVPSTSSGQVLWGTAAAAAIGAFLSDAIAEQRRK
jgi:hypothetical protein